MRYRKVPVEVAGYVDRYVWVVDSYRGIAAFRWCSFVNDNISEDDLCPWVDDSEVSDCPF